MRREFWIAHPAVDGGPGGPVRWFKWHLAEWLHRHARRLEHDALYPNCEVCGKPRNRSNHDNCDEIPF